MKNICPFLEVKFHLATLEFALESSLRYRERVAA